MTEIQIQGGPRAPESARARLTESLDAPRLAPVVDDLRLLVSELVTNCVVHGGVSEPGDAITIRTWVRADDVRTEVCHDGPAFAAPTDAPDLESPGGLGLFLVDQMSAAWGIDKGRRTCVWFELGLAA